MPPERNYHSTGHAPRLTMPLHYTIDPARRLVTITGEYSQPEEWRDLLRRVLSDPRRQPGFAFLRDLRGATTPVDAATVVGIIAVVRRYWPQLRPSRAAIVTPLEIDPAALVAHALADAQHIPLRTFTSYEDAMEWLGGGEVNREVPRPMAPD
jgi:hypothetical protein